MFGHSQCQGGNHDGSFLDLFEIFPLLGIVLHIGMMMGEVTCIVLETSSLDP